MVRYGVYPHSLWKVTDHRTGDGHAVPTGQGFVDREVTSAVPYGRIEPVRVFTRRSDADKLAMRLTVDLGLSGHESRPEILAALKRKASRDVPRPKAGTVVVAARVLGHFSGRSISTGTRGEIVLVQKGRGGRPFVRWSNGLEGFYSTSDLDLPLARDARRAKYKG
jgi:hypothetical protein